MRDATNSRPECGDHHPMFHHTPFGAGPGFGPAFGHHGGPDLDGRGRGRRRGLRAPRGDVRAAVLQLLGDAPMHGYQLMQQIAERSQGAWRPSPGTIYPVLSQLEDEGLVEITRDQGRKMATLTDDGRAFVLEHADELGDPFAALDAEAGARIDLREPVAELISATRQIARSGTAGQLEAARTVLREARRSLYLILATDDPEPTDTEGSRADGA